MKPFVRLRYLAAACGLLVTTFTIIGPRAAHAIVATLVQVANTPANPAHTQDVSATAAQIVELRCVGTGVFHQVFTDGSIGTTPYSVPISQSLVITSVDLLPLTPATQPVFANLYENIEVPSTMFDLREQWLMQTKETNLFQFPLSGIVFVAQSNAFMNFSYADGTIAGLDGYTATLHGYLTSN